ncbi:30S ribosomal protein S7 [bacterium]|nr:30S ribosomal protein S7 [bacterium]MBU1025609.1 30S ribosomal protein S7 [bacterium]
MRGKSPKKRQITPDPVYKSDVLARFINKVIWRGKKSTAESAIYDAFEIIKEKTGEDPYDVFLKALKNVKPMVEVKSRRVGGSTYQVPIEIKPIKQEAIAMRWIIQYSRSRKGIPFHQKLAAELLDAYNNTGTSVKKKEDTHKMAEANRAYAHYRF